MSFSGLLFVLLFVTGCLLALRRHPVWGAATYMATFFLSPQMRWWGQGTIGEIRWAYISAAVTVLALLLTRKATRPVLAFTGFAMTWLLALFVAWLALQSLWALDSAEHADLLNYYVKFVVSLALIYFCADSEESLRVILWTYVAGCTYFGWIAFTTYTGGRFEGFGGAGINEANAGALTIVIGIFTAGSLFLAGNGRAKILLFFLIPIIVDALVTTISRSGFLALAAGGLVYNWFTPGRLGRRVRVLSALAIVLFLMLTGPTYWTRMQSIEHAGEDVQGVDTGEDRLAIIKAQWRMFKQHPMGCGAMCTAVLSPQFIDERYLTSVAPGSTERRRASHNTFMTMLVEHGIPGALFYIVMLLWEYMSLRKLAITFKQDSSFMPTLFPAVAAVLAGITVGDMFVSYAKFEIRVWYLAILMAMLNLVAQRQVVRQSESRSRQQSDSARLQHSASGPALR